MNIVSIQILIIMVFSVSRNIYKVILRQIKKRAYGDLILRVRDETYIKDIFWGLGFFLVGSKFLYSAIVNGMREFDPYLILMVFSIYSITFFVKAFSHIEIRENGMLSKESFWEWEDVEGSYFKEVKNTLVIIFKFKSNKGKQKITISEKDKAEFENQIENVLKKYV